MHNDYMDIRSRIAKPPTWWDENGVPRYGSFSTRACPKIYANEIVLFRVTCQSCKQTFDVCRSLNWGEPYFAIGRKQFASLADAIRERGLVYGDPPNACPDECIGHSMGSIPRQVLEYWRKQPNKKTKLPEWVRDHSLEIDIMPEGWEA